MSKHRGRMDRIRRRKREREERRGNMLRAGAGREPSRGAEAIRNRPGYAMAVSRINQRAAAVNAEPGDIMAVIRDPEGREAIASLSGGSGVEARRERRRRLRMVRGDD